MTPIQSVLRSTTRRPNVAIAAAALAFSHPRRRRVPAARGSQPAARLWPRRGHRRAPGARNRRTRAHPRREGRRPRPARRPHPHASTPPTCRSRSLAPAPSRPRPKRSCGWCASRPARKTCSQARGAGRSGPRPTCRRPSAEVEAAVADLQALRAAARAQERARRSSATTPPPGVDVAKARLEAAQSRVDSRRGRAGPREGRRPPRGDWRGPGAHRHHRGRHRHPRGSAARTRRWSRRWPASSPTSWPKPARWCRRAPPVVVITDLDHAWADVYVPEPAVPRITHGPVGHALHRRRRRRHPRHRHLHLAQGRVHAAQRADRGGARQARLPHPHHRRQQRPACSSRACRWMPTWRSRRAPARRAPGHHAAIGRHDAPSSSTTPRPRRRRSPSPTSPSATARHRR